MKLSSAVELMQGAFFGVYVSVVVVFRSALRIYSILHLKAIKYFIISHFLVFFQEEQTVS